RRHRRALRNYREWHDQGGPTLLGLMKKNVKRWLFITAATAVVLAWTHITSNYETLVAASLVNGGVLLGAIASDLAGFRAFIRFWPTHEQTIDWQRVQALLDQPD